MNVLITGANGYLGYQTVYALLNCQQISNITALVRNSEKYISSEKKLFPPQVKIIDINTLLKQNFDLRSIDVICHLAAGRQVQDPKNMASSLEFTSTLMSLAIKANVKLIINASSQAVYGTSKPMWKESDEVAPITIHGQAKWASELMTRNVHTINTNTNIVSLRFSKLIGPSNNFKFADELPHILAKKVLMRESITLKNGGNQLYDLMDVRDASLVITHIITKYRDSWPQTINVGSGKQVSSLQIAQLVSKVSKARYGKELDFHVEQNSSNTYRNFGMSTTVLEEILHYKPHYTLENSINDIFLFIQNKLKR